MLFVLETLTLDASSMTYPPYDVCNAGTESIQQFLCKGKQGEQPVDGGERSRVCCTAYLGLNANQVLP